MKLTITSRNMVVTPAITKRIEKKTETMGRYLWPETEMQIKMTKEKARRVVEITVPMGKNLREEIPDIPEYIEEDLAEETPDRKIVKRKTFPVRPMSVEDAVIEMELLGHNFFAFVNIDTERTNVLYLRKDGDLGLLEPEA